MVSPDRLSERQVQAYILYLRDELLIAKGPWDQVRRIRSRKLLNGKSSWRTWCVASAESISLKMVTWCCRRIREPWRISPPAVPSNSVGGCTDVTTVLNPSGFFTAAAIGPAQNAMESKPNSGSQNANSSCCHVTTIMPLRQFLRSCETCSDAIKS